MCLKEIEMQKYIIKILLLLLSGAAVLSCSKVADAAFSEEGLKVEIQGIVTDADSDEPLEGILIQILGGAEHVKSVDNTISTYTGENGRFAIFTLYEDTPNPSKIIATATDLKGEYGSAEQEMVISSSGAYNIGNGIFFINNCNFHLKKSE